MAKQWIPEIMYEEDQGGVSSNLPFVLVPVDQQMPSFLLLWEHKDTGEIEPGSNGEDMPIVQPTLRQYAQMDVLKEKLSPEAYDDVRAALGLDPMKTAIRKGALITAQADENVHRKNKSRPN